MALEYDGMMNIITELHVWFIDDDQVVEDWELSRLELGLQGSKEQWKGSLQVIARQMLGGNKFQEAFEAER